MRSKLKTPLFLALFGLVSIATACGDDGGGTSDGDAGESGNHSGGSSGSTGTAGSKPGTAGTASGNGGSASGNGGSVSGNGGSTSGNGGTEPTSGGEPSYGGEPSNMGGEPSNNGGQPNGHAGEPSGNAGEPGAGGSGPSSCTAITPAAFASTVAIGYAAYRTTITPNQGEEEEDRFSLLIEGPPDYDGGQTGTFDLTQNGDDNYKTCTRCVLATIDPTGAGRKVFYASAGTLVIDAGSKQLNGNISATLSNLKLVEVEIDSDGSSTPVADGACLTLASLEIDVEAPECEGGYLCANGYCLTDPTSQCDGVVECPDESDEAPVNEKCIVPEGWTCDEGYVGDGDCDCGCGAKDTDCTSTDDEGECTYCLACGDTGQCSPGYVDPADTTSCL